MTPRMNPGDLPGEGQLPATEVSTTSCNNPLPYRSRGFSEDVSTGPSHRHVSTGPLQCSRALQPSLSSVVSVPSLRGLGSKPPRSRFRAFRHVSRARLSHHRSRECHPCVTWGRPSGAAHDSHVRTPYEPEREGSPSRIRDVTHKCLNEVTTRSPELTEIAS